VTTAYVGDDLAHQCDQVRWVGGMVSNHVADIVARHGTDGPVAAALTGYIAGRTGHDYNEASRQATAATFSVDAQ
jgi:hypothetical protein